MKTRHTARCRALIERLSRFIDDDLTGAERRAVREHLRRCPCCDDFADSLRRTVRLCQDARRTRLPAEVRARARARVRALLTARVPPKPRRA